MSGNQKGRVLIVEDDLLLSMVEERLIKKLGFDVIGKIDNGYEAVEKAEELDPDIIVMDISLKGEMDGIETMEMIREQSSVPVIYLSGSGDRYLYERAKKTGFTEYLTKPITSSDLETPLNTALERKNGQEQSGSSSHQFNKTA
jgi:CheY-like chemotaxis protein